MDDVLFVCGFEPLCNLYEQLYGLIDGYGTLCDPLRQGLAFHQLHDDELLPVVPFESIERCDVLVIHLCEQPRFSLETIQTFSVSRELLGEDFDGNVTAQFAVASAGDFSHAASANRLDDFVLAELGAG